MDLVDPANTGYRPGAIAELQSEARALGRFLRMGTLPNSVSDPFYRAVLKTTLDGAAWQIMLPLGDILCLNAHLREGTPSMRINVPDTSNTPETPEGDRNWGTIYPALDDLLEGSLLETRQVSEDLPRILRASGRAV
jgi:hypothetical protein